MIFGENEADIIEHLQLFYITGLQNNGITKNCSTPYANS